MIKQMNKNISQPKIYNLQTIHYRQALHAINTDKDYYALARVVDHPNELSVTEVGGRGGGLFFCTLHNFVHHPTETCEGCRTGLPQEATDMGVTTS